MAAVAQNPYLNDKFDPSSSVWSDVTPVPQDDGEDPLVPILYNADYSGAMDLLRAILPADELSARALSLTGYLVQIAASNYTVWYYRARILVHGPENEELGPQRERLTNELAFLDDLARDNMKSYQVWQHRRLVVQALEDPSREFAFTQRVFAKDAKNYHTWVYRQWVLSHFGGLGDAKATHPEIWDGEMGFIAELLHKDARNNSAWNHRYFCLFSSKHALATDGNGHRLCSQVWQLGSTFAERIQHEIEYAKDAIKTIPHNASAWNYLRGVSKLAAQDDETIGNSFACARDLAQSLVPSDEEARSNAGIDAPPRSPPLALEWLLDDVDAQVQAAVKASQDVTALLQGATFLVTRLCVADVIRKRFWAYRLATIRRRASATSSRGASTGA